MDRILQALAEATLSQGQTLHQIGESQKQMTEILSHRISGTDDTAKSSQFVNLATRLGKFVHDPTRGKTFTLWFERHRSTFVEGARGLTDTEEKELLLNALGDDEYQQLLSRLSPKKPQEMTLADLVKHLRKQFHDNKTLFQRRFEALNFRASPPATAIEILDKVNLLGDAFELDNFNVDQLKILLTALALSDHTYYTERTVLFKVASEKENCTFQDIREICYAHANRTADVMRVEGQRFSEINALSQSTKNSPKKKGKYYEKKTHPTTLHYEKKRNSTTLSPCYGCGSTKHKRNACPFKNAACRICKKTGHIARVCLSKQRNKINTVTLQGVLGTGHRYRKYAHITMNNKPLKIQLDTGADVTTIGRETWTRIGRPKLQPFTTSCVNVSGHPMHTIGFFNASLGYKDCMIKAQVIVLDRPETALLSSQAIDELGLITYDTGVVGNLQMMNTITVNSFHKQFTELFSSSTGECTKMTVHLRLKPDAKPKHIPRRPIALALEEPVNEELDRLVKNGILTPVDFSEWAAPIVVARKANGKIRICADYSTGLNDALDAEDYPIPGIEELMAKLRGSSIFSQLDLSDAYFHLRLDEESKKLTTINTHRGLFAYNRLVFGLKPAPAIFQRTLEQALTGIPGVLVYLDDILIYGQERTEHDTRLHAVLNRLQEWGFRLQKEKCKLHTSVVKYLGFIVSAKGIEPDPARLRPIQTMRAPTNTKEIRSFLGLINYYGKFVPNLHRLKAPFEALIKKDVPFVWTAKMKKTFEEIKNILTGPLLLAHYDPRQTLIVAADASSIGIGGVLLQRAPDGQVKAVFHMSKALTKTQQNYSQIEKEALALVTAVERFRKFVYGRHFVLQTDHRPLLALFKTSNTKGLDTRTANRLKRWALRLIGYDFDIEYVNSEKFGQADALSRLIQDVKQDVIDADLEEVVAALQETDTELQQIVNESVQFLPSTARQELQSATYSDGILAEVIDRLQNGWLKSDVTDKELMPYYRRRDYLAIVDNTLVLDEKLVIPERLQSTVLKQLHIAHPGIRRMIQLARRYFYWPAMHDDIERYVKGCNHCDRTASNPVKEPLHPWPNSEKSWSRLHIDFAGPIHGQWVLVIVDSYSKFVEAGWFSTITSAATCRYLRRLFSRYGPPEVLVSDNGTQFTSVEFAQLCAEFRILHLRTPPGHPQSNGQAERMVRTLKSSIDTSQSSQLETELNKFVYAYNYTPSDAVPNHKSPAEIFFGRKLRTPLDIFTATEKPNLSLTSRQEQMKQQFDAHHGARPRSFVIGQSVLIQLSNGQRIPGKIVKLIGKALARVSFDGGFITRHFNQIWNRSKRQEGKSNTISEDLLSSGKESARIQPDPVLHTSLGEREEAEPLNNGTTQPPVAPARSERPSGATQPPVAAARRSERLAHQIRPDYKALGGTRPYRGQHS